MTFNKEINEVRIWRRHRRIGANHIGQATARRVGVGKHVVLADRSEANAKAAADVMGNASYTVSVALTIE